LSAAGWHTAERTNALAYMDYADVQEYAKLYDFQNLYVIYQRQMLDRGVSTLSKIVGSDAHTGARQLISPRTAIFAAQKAPPADRDGFARSFRRSAASSWLMINSESHCPSVTRRWSGDGNAIVRGSNHQSSRTRLLVFSQENPH
jgi:hypothetical protein